MRTKLLILCALALCASACTLVEGDGSPWGEVDFGAPSFTLDISDRVNAESGRLRVGNGYELELVSLQLDVGTIRLDLAPQGASVASFDPADPPAGYSLCHNGHCHADDGRLVDYEDIAIELATASGVAGSVGQVIGQAVTLEDDATTSITLDPDMCPDNCALPLGQMTRVVLSVERIRLDARVFDARDERRQPEEGAQVELVLDSSTDFSALVQGSIEKDRDAASYNLSPTLEFSGALFDDIDWQVPGTWRTSFARNIAEESSFSVNLSENSAE